MRFIHPEFLYFSLFALVPIVLYLLNLQKTVRVLFPNVSLLEQVKKQTSNKFQAKRLLITLSRVFFILAIVLAFAQPTFKNLLKIERAHHIIYLDNSLSMTRNVGASLLLQEAKALINKKIPDRKGDLYSLVTNSNFEILRDYSRKSDLLNEITKVQPSNAVLNGDQLFSFFRRKKTDLKKICYVISDLPQSNSVLNRTSESWENFTDSLSVLQLDGDPSNIFIDSLWSDIKYIPVGNAVKLNFRIVNETATEQEVLIKCLVEGAQTSSVVLKVAGNSKANGEIESIVSNVGINKCELLLEDETVAFDNSYKFILKTNQNIKTMIIKGNSESYVAKALRNEPLFFVSESEEKQINTSLIREMDLIVLESIKALDRLPIQDLKQFVVNGGHLTLIPTENQQVESVKRLVASLGINLSIDKVEKEKHLVDLNETLTKGFLNNVFEKSNQKTSAPFFQPLFGVRGSDKLIVSIRGFPLVSKIRVGDGNLNLVTTALVDSKSNFHRHSLFVPFSYRMAMQSSSTNENLSFNMNSEELKISHVNPNASLIYSLVSNKKQYVEDQRVIGKDLILYMKNNEETGFYDVVNKNDRLTTIALNYNREESYLQASDLADLNKYDNIGVTEVSVKKEGEIKQIDQSEIPIWKILIIISLLFLLVETVLIRFFK